MFRVAQMNSASLDDAVVQTAGQQRQEDSSKDKHQLQSIFKVQRTVTADDIQLLLCKHQTGSLSVRKQERGTQKTTETERTQNTPQGCLSTLCFKPGTQANTHIIKKHQQHTNQYVYSLASTCMTRSITQTLRQPGRGVSSVDYS